MNPRQPYPSPYGLQAYPVSTPAKGPTRAIYYDSQQPQPPYYQQSLSVYGHQGAPPAYGAPPPIYPQAPSYYGAPYQKQMLYEQQQPLYVPQPPPAAEPSYIGYQEMSQPTGIYQRAAPPQQSVLHPQPVQPVAQPVALAKPPPPKKERQVTGPPAKPTEDLRFQVQNRQSIVDTETPPGEFDMIPRGRLPAIVFQSEVEIKT